MPILNYTTSVSASRTANELQGLLGDKRAKRVSVDYNNDGDPIAIEFMITLVEQPVWFRQSLKRVKPRWPKSSCHTLSTGTVKACSSDSKRRSKNS